MAAGNRTAAAGRIKTIDRDDCEHTCGAGVILMVWLCWAAAYAVQAGVLRYEGCLQAGAAGGQAVEISLDEVSIHPGVTEGTHQEVWKLVWEVCRLFRAANSAG